MEVSLSISEEITLSEDYAALIAEVLTQGMAAEGINASEISVLITTDEEMRFLNNKHRGFDKPTDVLSFPQYDGFDIPADAGCLGDIVISLHKAAAQADEFGHSLRRELAFLTAHGLLHLLGYDHEASDRDERDMIRKQEELLTRMNIVR